MMKKIFVFLLVCLSPLLGLDTSPVFQGPSHTHEPQLVVNNCPLAKINGKIISLIDVVKRMDMFLYDYDPTLSLSTTERFQFYQSRWEQTLDEMIGNQMALIDAELKELKVSDGDVHEEIEERFGPNVIANLDKVRMTFEEAKEVVREDLLIRQVMWYKVHSKVLQKITPQVIKAAYQDYLAKNPPVESWTYRVLSVRGKDQSLCETIAKHAHALLTKEGKTLEETLDALKNESEEITITVSDELSGETPTLSKQHYAVLKDLSTQAYSEPTAQISRFDQSTVSRIFYLDTLEEKTPTDFEAMHDPLKNQLLNQSADKEKKAYISHLKKRFGYDKLSPQMPLPDDYQPFLLY